MKVDLGPNDQQPILPLAICCFAAIGITAAFLEFLPIPVFFINSTAVIGAVCAFVFAIGFTMMLPDRLLYSDAQLIKFHFGSRHGISDDRANAALSMIQRAHSKASMLRRAGKSVQADLRADLAKAADQLDGIAGQLMDDPQAIRHVQPLVIRSDLLVEAATAHAELRKAASETVVNESRQKIRAGLAAFQEGIDTLEASAAAQLMHRIEASTSTAELLLGDGKGSADKI